MNLRLGFIAGMGAGLLAGAAAGAVMPYGRNSMKTEVGKSLQKFGVAIDRAVDNMISNMR